MCYHPFMKSLLGHRLSQQLKMPLHIIIVRKLLPQTNPEAGFRAVTLNGTLVNNQLVQGLDFDHLTEARVEGD
ncbi:MAG: hypothetical protein ACUVTM_07690 [Candidatus Bathyarchaeia archaeon]